VPRRKQGRVSSRGGRRGIWALAPAKSELGLARRGGGGGGGRRGGGSGEEGDLKQNGDSLMAKWR
jgi:hypothetical protein